MDAIILIDNDKCNLFSGAAFMLNYTNKALHLVKLECKQLTACVMPDKVHKTHSGINDRLSVFAKTVT